ncbi:hypothetical protein G6F68_011005 [Rhizopus microsporus]|nr:hypothetical protein G6F68_011005 [Rhizopus microsporus]
MTHAIVVRHPGHVPGAGPVAGQREPGRDRLPQSVDRGHRRALPGRADRRSLLRGAAHPRGPAPGRCGAAVAGVHRDGLHHILRLRDGLHAAVHADAGTGQQRGDAAHAIA